MADPKRVESKYAVGDRVRVIDGTWCKGLAGVVEKVDHEAHKGRCPIVVVNLDEAHHGQLRLIDLQLEKLPPEAPAAPPESPA